MPSKLNAYWLAAVVLSAQMLCAPGAPVPDAATDSPAEDPSGEEEVEPSDLLSSSPVLESFLGATNCHQKDFEDEFHNEVKYHFLDHYKVSSVPARCLKNVSQEACLHSLVHGLFTYQCLLKHVEREYPKNLIVSKSRHYSGLLISVIKEKMGKPEEVTPLSGSQEEQLLKGLENPDTFHRKMTAHSILRQLHIFLVEGKRSVARREMQRRRRASKSVVPIWAYWQNSKR